MMSADYQVGYKKPPTHTRFQKGRSGNPKGRAKSKKSSDDKLRAIFTELVTVREGDKVRRISKLEAVLVTSLNKALKGDPKAFSSALIVAKDLGLLKQPGDTEKTIGAILRVPYKASSSEEWEKLYSPRTETQKDR